MAEVKSDSIDDSAIAIIGMAARLPSVNNIREYWQLLRDGTEAIRDLSDAELFAAGVSPELLSHPQYVKRGAVMNDVAGFDAEFFGFNPKEAAIMDPQHRHFLECAWEAIEDAGHIPERFDGRVGVFAGCGMGSYFAFNLLTNPELVKNVGLFLLRHTGNDKDFLATRVSYSFNLNGPSVNVQTACSTSLVAIHTACQNLLNGECDMALAGGVTIEIPHARGYLYQTGDILAPDGRCRAFDQRAQGTVFGSGAGVVVLRRLEDALRDGDHVYAIIKGSAVNNDGAGKVGFFAPSVAGQSAAVAEALSVAGVSADSIQYIECHGTGTAVGDPIEVAGLTQAFRASTQRRGFCSIGSVKTNIGHLDTAAGVASMIKVALALEAGELPATIHYEQPNSQLDLENSPFKVNQQLTPWPRGAQPRRSGVTSLGVGGTNAHVVVEEAPAFDASTPSEQPYQMLVLSARNGGALDAATQRLAAELRARNDLNLADVAYTLRVGRRAFSDRRVVAAASLEEAVRLLDSGDPQRVFKHKVQDNASVVFMFPGGGAQYHRMGYQLYQTQRVFREWVDRGCEALRSHVDFDLKALLFSDEARYVEASKELERPAVQLPALLIVEYALAQLWLSWGVRPAALIGHSMGENTAACLAGVLSFEDALGLVALRGKLFERITDGGMLSVPLSSAELQPLLGEHLDLATVNAPQLCTVSGPTKELDKLQAQLLERQIEAKRIAINIAAHSRMLEPILAEFGDYLRTLKLSAPQIPLVSNVTGNWLSAEQATNPQYWVDHLRHTVQFAQGLGTLLQTPGRVFLEVGPGKNLSSLVRQHHDMNAHQAVLTSLRHPKESVADEAYFLTTLGRLWAAGVDIDLDRLWQGESRRRVSLPTYAFQHESYWIEPGKGAVVNESRQLHKLLDQHEWYYRPTWRPRAADVSSEPLESQTWLVFNDEAGVGTALVERLRGAGHDVICVEPGDAYHKFDDHRYLLSPEHGRDGYDALLRDLAGSGKIPSRIVHLWLTTASAKFRPGSSFFHRNQEQGFYSLFFLAQAWLAEGLPGAHWTVIGNGLQQVADEPLLYPDKATVLGPALVIPRELPDTTCACVDIELPAAPHGWFGGKKRRAQQFLALVDTLWEDITQQPTNAVVAHRGVRRYERVHDKIRSPKLPAEAVSRIRSRGTYLITGGFGGIGGAVAEHLARTARAQLILVGRTLLPPREEWNAYVQEHALDDAVCRRIVHVRKLESLGATVQVVSADVTDADALRAAVQQTHERLGPIHGVFHAAGILRDGLIPMKSQSDIEEVFTPKIQGTLVLDEVLSGEPLDFFVVFSSTSTAIAPAGQVDYVAANAYLNAFAAQRTAQGRPTLAINWGIWNEVGMAAELRAGATNKKHEHSETFASQHPLFDARRGGPHAEQVVLTARYSPFTHWILDEHRTAEGQALLPGTGYLELARAALAELRIQQPIEIQDLFFLRPLYVADDSSRDIRVRLQRGEQGYAFAVQSRAMLDDGQTGWQTHAQARIMLDDLPAPAAIDPRDIAARCMHHGQTATTQSLRTRQEDHLLFGPRWRVLREMAFGTGEALAHLELPSKFVGDLRDFRLHPALLDLATGFAMDLIDGYEQCSELWVPVSYRRLRCYGALPPRIVSWVRNRGANRASDSFVQFDVTIADESGRVLVEIEEFTIKRLAEPFDLAALPAPLPSELELDSAETKAGTHPLSAADAALEHNLRQGILPAEGVQALEQALQARWTKAVVVSSLDLRGLIEQSEQVARRVVETHAKSTRPQMSSDFVAPTHDIERTLAGIWEELLGVEQVGVRDNFFDLGGHSLIAVRLFAMIKKTFQVDLPMSVLFEAPTIESGAQVIEQAIDRQAPSESEKSDAHRTRYTHLVAMHEGQASRQTPLFIVAGMFGNVLNLRHLAHLIGRDRPCYGLQARGLYGDHVPHETFEEMAADYIREMRDVQPRGPYMLSGFSGGGITAYEIARQLIEAGEDVSLLALLDTPLPKDSPLLWSDKLKMHYQKWQRERWQYFGNMMGGRLRWEWQKVHRKLFGAPPAEQGQQFHNRAIQAAFYRACERYVVRPLPVRLTLFRPPLNPVHVFGPNRMINHDRRFIYPDNGWTPYVTRVEVHEVRGDHDSMVLEPQVRGLGAKLAQAIQEAEARRVLPSGNDLETLVETVASSSPEAVHPITLEVQQQHLINV